MRITEGLVVFVTGGASGLGEATVRYLHSKGASVAVADMNTERLDLIKKELKDRVLTIKCDVTNEKDVGDAVD
jgi:NADP-dependent 3-hydroxy acid dehydrogenase YdfG